jgi:small subunit ribosomal protein S16
VAIDGVEATLGLAGKSTKSWRVRQTTKLLPAAVAGASEKEEDVAVRLRLTRVGGNKDPMWRVVVADQRSPRDGRVIETIGHYNAQTNPSTIVIDEERARSWLARGAQPSDTVRKLLRIQGIESRTG